MSAKNWDESNIGKSWNKLFKCTGESDRNSEGADDDVDVNSLSNDMEVPSYYSRTSLIWAVWD